MDTPGTPRVQQALDLLWRDRCWGPGDSGFQLLKGMVTKRRMRNPVALPVTLLPRLPCTLSCASQGKAVSSTAQITSTARRNPAITIMSQLHHFRDVLKITTNLAESPRLSNTLWAPKLEQGDWLLVRWEL